MIKFLKALIVVGLIGILGILMVTFNRSNEATREIKPIENVITTEKIEQLISEFYFNPEERDYLRKEKIEDAELADIKEKINDLNVVTAEKKELLDQISQIEWKKNAITEVSKFYKNIDQVISEDRIEENAEIDEKITPEQIVKFTEEVINQAPVELKKNEEKQYIGDKLYNDLVQLVESVSTQINAYTDAGEKLNQIDKIKIEDGQIGNIAKALREFENQLKLVEDKNLQNLLNKKVQTYLNKFLRQFKVLLEEIPGYYDVAIPAMKPSKLLMELVRRNNLETTVTTTVTTTVETVEQEESQVTYEPVTQPQYVEPVITTAEPAIVTEVTESPAVEVTESFE